MAAAIVKLGRAGIGVTDIALHIFETGAVVQGSGDESRAHGVGTVTAVEPEERRVLPQDSIH